MARAREKGFLSVSTVAGVEDDDLRRLVDSGDGSGEQVERNDLSPGTSDLGVLRRDSIAVSVPGKMDDARRDII